MDRRLTPFSGRIAHESLKGHIADVPFTKGAPAMVGSALTLILKAPDGAVDRQLIHGDLVTVIDQRDGYAYVMADKDGYCGWVSQSDLTKPIAATHRVISPATHLYDGPKVQANKLLNLYLNARVAVLEVLGKWALTDAGYIPARHLAPLQDFATDPVAVAETLLRAPYYWGGNAVAGVDCSGLVQLSFHACGKQMAGDSDLQEQGGADVPPGAEQRGDLIFWKGHIAIVAGPDLILHANAHHMCVAYEGLAEAIARIEAQGDGPVTARKRY